jgi:hypothetical protein
MSVLNCMDYSLQTDNDTPKRLNPVEHAVGDIEGLLAFLEVDDCCSMETITVFLHKKFSHSQRQTDGTILASI